jgi:hypothetical protein
MQELNVDVLTLILGLSVYVSSIRFLVLNTMLTGNLTQARKNSYKFFLLSLIPADVAFVLAGLALFLKLFLAVQLLPDSNIVASFGVGVLWLIGHHFVSWFKTAKANFS